MVMEPPERPPRYVPLSELEIVPSPRAERGYASKNIKIMRGDIIEVPKDMVGANYVNPGEKPNVELLEDGRFMATRNIYPGEELLTKPYGEGFVGENYLPALASVTFGITPFNVAPEMNMDYSEFGPLGYMGDESGEAAYEARELAKEIAETKSLSKSRKRRNLGWEQYFGRSSSIGHIPVERPRTKPRADNSWEIQAERELKQEQKQIADHEKKQKSGKDWFSGPTTQLYRIQGKNKPIITADVPQEYLRELERRKGMPMPAKGVLMQRRAPQGNRNLIFSLPRIGGYGLLSPIRRPIKPVFIPKKTKKTTRKR
jgi:hypothetical protein